MVRTGVLVACPPDALSDARHSLSAEKHLRFVHNLDAANRLILTRSYEVILVTLRFHDSRPFDLLSAAKDSETPIILAKLSQGILSRHAVKAAFIAARAVGFDDCIDLQSIERSIGREAALRHLHETIAELSSSHR